MVFINIDTNNYKKLEKNGKPKIQNLNDIIRNKKSKVFIIYYMIGCGPCNATRPEWAKLENVLKKFKHDNSVAIVDMDQILSDKVHKIPAPNSFPTIRLISDGGKKIVNYEDSDITNKDRSIDSFVEWINSETKHHTSKNYKTYHRKQQGGTRKKNSGKKTRNQKRKYL